MGLGLLHAEVRTQHVGFCLFDREGLVAERFGDGALAVHGLFHAQSLRNLAESDDPVKGTRVQMGLVGILQQGHAHREDGTVELLADDVVEQDGTGAQLFLDLRVVREVDGDHLESGVGIAAVIDDVAGEDVGFTARDELVVGRIAGKHLLELGQAGGQGIEFFRALEILQEHIGAEGVLDPVQGVVHGLVRAQDQVHLAVGHVQPGLLALVVIVRAKTVDLLE